MGTSNLQPLIDGNPATFSAVLQARREFVTRELQDICLRNAKPKILSVANGQMREAEPVFSLCQHKGGEFVALDRDFEPLDLVCREYETQSVRKLHSHFPGLPPELRPNDFHYIYALNLFAELKEQAAKALLSALFSKLRRGGILLVSNFTPEAEEFSAMGSLFRRTEKEMAGLAEAIPARELVGHAIWRDDYDAVAYLEIRK